MIEEHLGKDKKSNIYIYIMGALLYNYEDMKTFHIRKKAHITLRHA